MKFVSLTCPNCGSIMDVDAAKKEVVCEFCGTKFMVDDETKAVEIKNAEKIGYDFEKGRQKAIKDEKKKHEKELLEAYNKLTEKEKKELVNIPNTSISKKQKKRAIIIGVILGVLLITGITGSLLLKTNQPLYTKLSLALMPETIEYTDEDTGETITFYIEENKDYNEEKDDPINAYTTYYYDADDNKVVLENGLYISDKEFAESKKIGNSNSGIKDYTKYNIGTGQQVTVGFLFKAQEKANKVTSVVKAVVAVFAVCCVIYLIYLWYLNWSVREDKKKQKLAEAEDILNDKNKE